MMKKMMVFVLVLVVMGGVVLGAENIVTRSVSGVEQGFFSCSPYLVGGLSASMTGGEWAVNNNYMVELYPTSYWDKNLDPKKPSIILTGKLINKQSINDLVKFIQAEGDCQEIKLFEGVYLTNYKGSIVYSKGKTAKIDFGLSSVQVIGNIKGDCKVNLYDDSDGLNHIATLAEGNSNDLRGKDINNIKIKDMKTKIEKTCPLVFFKKNDLYGFPKEIIEIGVIDNGKYKLNTNYSKLLKSVKITKDQIVKLYHNTKLLATLGEGESNSLFVPSWGQGAGISSLKLKGKNCKVYLNKQQDFGGTSFPITSDVSDLSNYQSTSDWNDQVAAIEVEGKDCLAEIYAGRDYTAADGITLNKPILVLAEGKSPVLMASDQVTHVELISPTSNTASGTQTLTTPTTTCTTANDGKITNVGGYPGYDALCYSSKVYECDTDGKQENKDYIFSKKGTTQGNYLCHEYTDENKYKWETWYYCGTALPSGSNGKLITKNNKVSNFLCTDNGWFEIKAENCSDGADNDLNGFTDCQQSTCKGQLCDQNGSVCNNGMCTEAVCNDQKDNDQNSENNPYNQKNYDFWKTLFILKSSLTVPCKENSDCFFGRVCNTQTNKCEELTFIGTVINTAAVTNQITGGGVTVVPGVTKPDLSKTTLTLTQPSQSLQQTPNKPDVKNLPITTNNICNIRTSCQSGETEILDLNKDPNKEMYFYGGATHKLCCQKIVLETPNSNKECPNSTLLFYVDKGLVYWEKPTTFNQPICIAGMSKCYAVQSSEEIQAPDKKFLFGISSLKGSNIYSSHTYNIYCTEGKGQDCKDTDCSGSLGYNNNTCCFTSKDCGDGTGGATCQSTNECYETSCTNKKDDDGDGLIDCQEDYCQGRNCGGDNICINKVCTSIPDAQKAAIKQVVPIIPIFSYVDILKILNKCTVKTGSSSSCASICSSGQTGFPTKWDTKKLITRCTCC